MKEVTGFGAGAFGTALAISLARQGHTVKLIARRQEHADAMIAANENSEYLAGFPFPDGLSVSVDPTDPAMISLLAIPTQSLTEFVRQNRSNFVGRMLVTCCKGIDLKSGLGPTGIVHAECPSSEAAILSGPSFATDLAAGLPTALTLAANTDSTAEFLQNSLSTSALRLYRSTDTIGVELGGALKNIMAIGAGVTIGAGLGESARAALITRGYEELKRFAQAAGAEPATLSGLSGFGDLVLTCMSEKSRNYVHGLNIGRGEPVDDTVTVEGKVTAIAVAAQARSRNIDMPITTTIAQLLAQEITVPEAINALLSRPLKKE